MQKRNKNTLLLILSLLLIWFSFACAAGSSSAVDDFKRGKQAFAQKKYWLAVSKFNDAKAKGLHNPALYHNLGASYYFLAQYEPAKENFTQAYNFPEMRPLAAFNLGKVALKQGNKSYAYSWFKHVQAISRDSKLLQLATRQLEILGPYALHTSYQWSFYADIAAGHDDNVNFAPTDIATGREDSYSKLLLSTQGFLIGDESHGWSLNPYLQSTQYIEEKDSNYTVAHLGSAYHLGAIGIYHSIGLAFDHSFFGGEDFQNIVLLEYNGRYYPSSQSFVELKLQQQKFNSVEDQYAFLDGTQQQVSVTYRYWTQYHRWRAALVLEDNHREDFHFENDPRFVSYSPQRSSVSLEYEYLSLFDWRMLSSIYYSNVDYPEAQVVDNNGGNPIFVPGQRKDRQWQILVGFSYEINNELLAGFRVRTIKNDSNESIHAYDRNLIELSFSAVF